jgi:hypothetical protein
MRLDIRSMLHMVPGWYLRFVRVYSATDQDGANSLAIVDYKDRRCDTDDCTYWTTVFIDTNSLPAGMHEFRLHAETRPGLTDTLANLATTGWQVCIRSCSGRTPQATDFPEARGWYRDASGSVKGYVNARYNSATLPGVVSGTACFPLRTLQGAGDEPVTHSFASVDPAFHAQPENRGLVLVDKAGTIDGPDCVDTSRLSNGTHRLFFRADWGPGPLAGAFVVPFTVSN